MEKKIEIGSSVYFSPIREFVPGDHDYLIINDVYSQTLGNTIFLYKKNGDDYLLCGNLTKKEFIINFVNSEDPVKLGKFLVPEFVKFINFTIDDLKLLKDFFDMCDEKHEYQKIIMNAYIKNGKFELTDKQRLKAYKSYCKHR